MNAEQISWTFYLVDFFVILFACLSAALIERWYDSIKRRRLDINCDNCEKPLGLKRTPDKKFHLCKVCMIAFINEHTDSATGVCEFPEELVRKALGGRGYIRRKRGKKGKK